MNAPLRDAPPRLQHPPAKPRRCRFCGGAKLRSFADLGATPLCQRHVTPANYAQAEPIFPLHAWACDGCRLVQLGEFVAPDQVFADYAFFSGFSDTWLRHVEDYAAEMTAKLDLSPKSLVVEVASNDGTLLQAFRKRGIGVRGIEPADNVAAAARAAGVPTEGFFLGHATAARFAADHGGADLVAANNVLAHVPDLNDFVAGLAALLKADGVLTVEFPHLRNLIGLNQFDTIYHEHWSYFWVTTAVSVMAAHGLRVFDVAETNTHGGSARLYACRVGCGRFDRSARVDEQLRLDREAGYDEAATYDGFAEQVRETKRNLLSFLINAKLDGKSVAAYGAPGKGNTLLNYCGIGTDFVDFTVDRNPKKQGNFLPGSRIPIKSPDVIAEARPDYLLILPWNLRDEIAGQMAGIREWGGRFVVPIPSVEVF